MKTYTLEELIDKYIGIEGSGERCKYEQELALEYLKELGFWKNLKQELGKGQYFCHTSSLFRRLWNNVKGFDDEIIKLATEFLASKEDMGYEHFYSNCVTLFGNTKEVDYNKIRKEFCDYMINKLKNFEDSGDGRN